MASVSKRLFCCGYAKRGRRGVGAIALRLSHSRRLRTLSSAVVGLGSTPHAVAVPSTIVITCGPLNNI